VTSLIKAYSNNAIPSTLSLHEVVFAIAQSLEKLVVSHLPAY